MGETEGANMKNLIRVCLLAAFMMSTMAFPEDEVVPETALTLSLLSTRHPELKHANPKDAAHAKIKMMQAQGFNNAQCNQMATDAITGMTSTLKVEQDAVDALSTGADCLVTTPATRRLLSIATAQQHLDAAAAALVAATTDLATKEATLKANRAAPITLPVSIFLLTDSAAIIAALAADPTVVAAKQAVATVQTARDAANLVVELAQATYDTTLVDAQDSSQECLCNAKTAHDLAWSGAQKIVTDNTQAWKEAHHVKCAVDGTADDACSVPAFAATDRPLVTEASSADCATSTPSTGEITFDGITFERIDHICKSSGWVDHLFANPVGPSQTKLHGDRDPNRLSATLSATTAAKAIKYCYEAFANMSPEYKKGYPNCERTGKYYVGIAQNGHCLCNRLLDDGMYEAYPDCSDGHASSGENAGEYQYKVFNEGIPPPVYTPVTPIAPTPTGV